jgi:hypothetical protein
MYTFPIFSKEQNELTFNWGKVLPIVFFSAVKPLTLQPNPFSGEVVASIPALSVFSPGCYRF